MRTNTAKTTNQLTKCCTVLCAAQTITKGWKHKWHRTCNSLSPPHRRALHHTASAADDKVWQQDEARVKQVSLAHCARQSGALPSCCCCCLEACTPHHLVLTQRTEGHRDLPSMRNVLVTSNCSHTSVHCEAGTATNIQGIQEQIHHASHTNTSCTRRNRVLSISRHDVQAQTKPDALP